jgi:exonuclease SbcC
LEFDKRLNVIVGSNDSGKSSIIRAIHWVFFNEPNGDWMCRIDEKGEQQVAEVKIVFEDDTVIVRKKGQGVNVYEVDGDPYENFGYDVPSQVLEKLKIYPLITNKKTFNVHIGMQGQHPFLIHESGPVRASVLDVLTGNSILQKGISSFNK